MSAVEHVASLELDDADEGRVYKWEIEPHPYSSDFDVYVTDDDQSACIAAQEAAEHLWDDMEVGEEKMVKIKRNF